MSDPEAIDKRVENDLRSWLSPAMQSLGDR